MKITPADIAHIAALANLEVPEEDAPVVASELSRIVEYVAKLDALDTDDVEPTSHVVRGKPHPAREDDVDPREGTGDAGRTVGFFKVPRVIGNR